MKWETFVEHDEIDEKKSLTSPDARVLIWSAKGRTCVRESERLRMRWREPSCCG